MKGILLIIQITLFAAFNSFSQRDVLTFVHNGYRFQCDVETIIDQLGIAEDSSELYTKEFIELARRKFDYPSDSVVEVVHSKLYFIDILHIFDDDHSSVKISRNSDGEFVKCKVKYLKEDVTRQGIGGSHTNVLVIIDRKKRVEIVREVIGMNLSC